VIFSSQQGETGITIISNVVMHGNAVLISCMNGNEYLTGLYGTCKYRYPKNVNRFTRAYFSWEVKRAPLALDLEKTARQVTDVTGASELVIKPKQTSFQVNCSTTISRRPPTVLGDILLPGSIAMEISSLDRDRQTEHLT